MNANREMHLLLTMVGAFLYLFLLFAPVSEATAMSWSSLRPEGKVLSSLNEEQQKLILKTMSLTGGDESEPLQACEDLLNDSTVPYEVYRYAFLKRIHFYTVTKREWKALDIGKEWLKNHFEDPVTIHVCVDMIHTCATRRNDDFEPTEKDLEAVAEPVFRLFSPNSLGVADAHSTYAFGLTQYAHLANDTRLKLYTKALKHYQEADKILKHLQRIHENEEPTDFDRHKFNRLQHDVTEKIKSVKVWIENSNK